MLNPHEELVTCPFDKSHRILKFRIQPHLVKCAKNFKLKDFRICPYNTTHIVPEADLENHKKECEDRGKYFNYLQVKKTEKPSGQDGKIINTSKESWDMSSEETYDPNAYCTSVAFPLLVPLQGAQPKERVTYRLNQRWKAARVMDEQKTVSKGKKKQKQKSREKKWIPCEPKDYPNPYVQEKPEKEFVFVENGEFKFGNEEKETEEEEDLNSMWFNEGTITKTKKNSWVNELKKTEQENDFEKMIVKTQNLQLEEEIGNQSAVTTLSVFDFPALEKKDAGQKIEGKSGKKKKRRNKKH